MKHKKMNDEPFIVLLVEDDPDHVELTPEKEVFVMAKSKRYSKVFKWKAAHQLLKSSD